LLQQCSSGGTASAMYDLFTLSDMVYRSSYVTNLLEGALTWRSARAGGAVLFLPHAVPVCCIGARLTGKLRGSLKGLLGP
jgi:hypothetical protein